MQRFKSASLFLPTALVLASAPAFAQEVAPRNDAQALSLVSTRTGIALTDLSIVRSADASYPNAGRTVRSFKLVDRRGQVHGITLDERGEEISAELLVELDERARLAKYGRLEAALFHLVEAAGPQQRIPVAIWLVEQNAESNAVARPLPEEMEFLFPTPEAMDGFLDTAAGVRAQAVRRISDPIAQRLANEGVEVQGNDTSPVLYASLTPAQIQRVANFDGVERVYSTPEVQATLDVARTTTYASNVEALGMNGFGVRAAQIEVGGRVATVNPYLAGVIQDPSFVCAAASGHSTYVAGILRSTHGTHRGFAPAMTLWAGGSCSGNEGQLTNRSTAASNWGARAINCSFGRNDGRVVGSMDRYYDGLVLNSARTVVIAAGNEGGASGNVLSPATAYNVITVGAFDDKNSFLWAGDTMSTFTSFVDPISTHSDREKPEISAPGTGIKSTLTAWPWIGNYGSTNGTSYSSPMVCGSAVQMMQRNTVLQSWPESVKAILMASSTHDVEAPARLSEKEGAGSLVGIYADQITRRVSANWGGISYSCSAAATTDVTTMTLTAGRRVRMVIAWDNDPAYASYSTQPCADLDLQVVGPAGTVVTSSASWDNTYEIVDFTAPTTGVYKLRVHKFRCSLSPRYLGYAWLQL